MWPIMTLNGADRSMIRAPCGRHSVWKVSKRACLGSRFCAAFAGFDPLIVAGWTEADVARLLQDAGIIRHRGKIVATILGAQIYLKIEADIGFADFLWAHVGGKPLQTKRHADLPAHIPQAVALSKSLKSAGFKFCGPTITYAFMQAVGMVNDHMIT